MAGEASSAAFRKYSKTSPWIAVGAGFDHGVQNRAIASAEFRAVVVGLNLEFLDGVNGRLNHVRRFIQHVAQIRIIIDSVQQKIILQRTRAVHAESKISAHARARFAGHHPAPSCASCAKFLPFSGSVSMRPLSITSPIVLVSVSSSGFWTVTSTFCVTCPISSFTLASMRPCTSSWTGPATAVLKPAFSTLIV